MNPILLISVIVAAAAFLYSLLLLVRLKDWRIAVLAAMTGLLALQQMVVWAELIPARPAWRLPIGENLTVHEMLALGTSALAVFCVVFLGRMYRDLERAGKTRRHREQRLKDFADAGSDWQWEIDAELRFTYFSEGFARSTGLSPEGRLGRTRFDLMPRDADLAVWQSHYDELRARRPFRDFTYAYLDDHGRRRTCKLSGSPFFAADGSFQGYRGVGADVTAQTNSRDRLDAADHRMKEAIESLGDGFAWYDGDDRLVLCNTRLKQIYQAIGDLMVPGGAYESLLRAGVERGVFAIAEGQSEAWIAERLGRHRSGSDSHEQLLSDGRWIRIDERRSGDGGTVGIFTDITALKATQLALERVRGELEHRVDERTGELRHAKEEAEQANRSKSDFLAKMSHELRTPLNAILGFSEVIRDQLFGLMEKPIYAEYGRDIHRAGAHLLSLIDDLLDVSKIEAGKIELRDEAFSLTELIPDIVQLIVADAANKNIDLEIAIEPGLGRLRADGRATRQMLLNLLSNAVKFTPPKGRVVVTASADAGAIVVAVEDSGIGIAESDFGKVLAPFGQVESPMTGTGKGTGLGLTIVKSLIELHGGTLRLRSTLGQGTTASLVFPPARVIMDLPMAESGP